MVAIFIAALELFKYTGELPTDPGEFEGYSLNFLCENCISLILLGTLILTGYSNTVIKLSTLVVIALNIWMLYKCKLDIIHENKWYDWPILILLTLFVIKLSYNQLKK